MGMQLLWTIFIVVVVIAALCIIFGRGGPTRRL